MVPYTRKNIFPNRRGFSTDSSEAGRNGDNTKTVKSRHRAFVALGSNLGNRIGLIEEACRRMDEAGIKITRTSSLWETDPMYVEHQDAFVNGACQVETDLDPLKLLDELKRIEDNMGRMKTVDKGPRNIDLDILLYNQQVFDHPRLQIPHHSMLEREFVLRPLCQLITDERFPSSFSTKSIQDSLNDLPPSATPISTLTPLSQYGPSLKPLIANRPTHIMSVINVTPDSFSDGGLHSEQDLTSITSHATHAIRAGATIIDIGGQSSAPNAQSISAETETQRVVPAIRAIRATPEGTRSCISIDTYRASVAEAAIKAGADMINDVSGGTMDPAMLHTAAKLGVTICLTHMRGTPETMTKMTTYPPGKLISTVGEELLSRVQAAEAAGVRRWRIMLDPGIGFAKDATQNLEILHRLSDFRQIPALHGFPWLVGASRKRFVGRVTGVTEPRQRTWGTAATVAASVAGGADVVRVHDTAEMMQVAKMSDAIWRI
ncbi:MAG: hypothetical protein M1825_003604 [Sarcosagium campestre]|nr:MAG: hypothetical protein M1825_003604 [Sarcosagium campestre]